MPIFALLLIAFSNLVFAQVPVPARYFPTGYVESRAAFREECTNALATRQTYKIDSFVDPDLTVDVAYFGRGGSRLLVVQSGIHGIEGNAGAAVQRWLVERYVRELVNSGIDVLLIHALNPYGYKFGRRTDEFNVNLNRNFPTEPGLYDTDGRRYARMQSAFEPHAPVRSRFRARAAIASQIVWQFAANGFNKKNVSVPMNAGQYEFEIGLNFGGVEPMQQVRTLTEILEPHLPQYNRIMFLDVHTGLGQKGALHLMTANKSTPSERAALNGVITATDDRAIKFTDGATNGDFFNTSGDVVEFVARLVRPEISVVAATAEFGTKGTSFFSQLDSAVVMIAENQAFHHGADPAADAKIRRDFAEMFNPADEGWRTDVLTRADRLLRAIHQKF